jgi:nucleotide-binding universal stress UspA family protein
MHDEHADCAPVQHGAAHAAEAVADRAMAARADHDEVVACGGDLAQDLVGVSVTDAPGRRASASYSFVLRRRRDRPLACREGRRMVQPSRPVLRRRRRSRDLADRPLRRAVAPEDHRRQTARPRRSPRGGGHTASPPAYRRRRRRPRRRRARARCRHADVAHRIIERATSRGDDVIVLGPPRQTGLAESLLGDVSADIVRYAPCDVLIVAPPPARPRPADASGINHLGRGAALEPRMIRHETVAAAQR